jgi:hypothetical protein
VKCLDSIVSKEKNDTLIMNDGFRRLEGDIHGLTTRHYPEETDENHKNTCYDESPGEI